MVYLAYSTSYLALSSSSGTWSLLATPHDRLYGIYLAVPERGMAFERGELSGSPQNSS